MLKCGITAPKPVKIWNIAHTFVHAVNLLHVSLRNYQHLYAVKQCNFQNNYGALAIRESFLLCIYIQVFFYAPPEFRVSGKSIRKITNFDYFGDSKPTFGEIWRQRANLLLPRPSTIL